MRPGRAARNASDRRLDHAFDTRGRAGTLELGYHVGTADRLYERARAAMPGQGSIERLKLRSTRTPRPFATNIGYSVQLPLARRFGAGEGSCQHTGCRRPHIRQSYWPGFYLAGCLVPGSTRTRALRYTKWPVESQVPRYST